MKHELTRRILCALLCAAMFFGSLAAFGTVAGADGYSELKYGMKDDEGARMMQRRLIELGYLASSATGGYWDQTRDAVALYQASVGLPVNGKVASAEMLAMLFGDSYGGVSDQTTATVKPVETTPAPIASDDGSVTELRYAMEGSEAVKRMQTRLKELGFFNGGSSGGYWDQTKKAVAAFQTKAGLPVDGKVASVEMLTLLYSSAAPSVYSETTGSIKVPVLITPEPVATLAPEATAAPTETTAPVGYTELRAYIEGDAVRAMQARLKELGFFAGNATGGYYSVTITAVELFQRAAGLPVNGKVATVAMQERLFAADAPNAYSLSASYGELSYGMEKYGDAYDAYRKLQDVARIEGNVSAARIGAMRSAYRGHQWEEALAAADAVKGDKAATSDLLREADYVKAKASLARSDRDKAFSLFENLSRYPATDEGAEEGRH